MRPSDAAQTPPLSHHSRGDERLLELLRAVIDRAHELGGSTSYPLADDASILLDVDVDGTRCILVDARPQAPREHVVLSPREREIARMVAEGYPNKTIAAVLEISSWTVSTYLRRIFAKLGVRSRAAMVARLAEDDVLQAASTRSRTAPGPSASGTRSNGHPGR